MQIRGPLHSRIRAFSRILACAALTGAHGGLRAEGTGTMAGIPTPDVLPHRAVATALTWRSFAAAAPAAETSQLALGPDLAIRQGFADRLEAGFAATGGRHDLQLVSGRARLRLLDECGWQPALAVGILDLTGDRHPYGESLPPVAPAGAYAAAAENNSWYGVVAESFGSSARIAVGVGGGRFVGRESGNRWAHGAFAGLEARLAGPVSVVASFDGRGFNAGLEGSTRWAPAQGDGLDLGLTLAARHLQNFQSAQRDAGLRPLLAIDLTIALVPMRQDWREAAPSSDAGPGPGAPASTVKARPKIAAKRRPRPAAPPKAAPAAPATDAATVELARLQAQLHALRDRLGSINSSGYAALASEQVATAGDALERGEAAIDGGDPDAARTGLAEASTALDAARRSIETETGRPLRW